MQLQVKDFLESLDEALQPRLVQPGFHTRPAELAKPVILPPWFIDRCRRVYLSLPLQGDSRIIGITSAFRGEGRSSLAMGVATAIAADTREQTLLMECDLEQPALGRILQLESGHGFSEWLEGFSRLRVARMPYLPHLVALPAGNPHPDPARLLHLINESNVVGELRGRFRNIVLDLPSTLDVAYSSLAVRLAEQLLVVVRHGTTQLADLEKLLFLLGRDRISGIVLNATDYRTPEWLRRRL